MSELIDDLKRDEQTQKPPGKIAVSAYLTERQHERLEVLAGKAGKSHSKTIGKLIDLVFERLRNGEAA